MVQMTEKISDQVIEGEMKLWGFFLMNYRIIFEKAVQCLNNQVKYFSGARIAMAIFIFEFLRQIKIKSPNHQLFFFNV